MERNRSVSSRKPCDFSTMTGLRLGRRKEHSSCFPAKRSRPSNQNTCCQVEGCDLDLKSAKEYHRRHRICESHSKSPRVIVSGMERRFCQQCSRFHDLSEFDDNKRSCRRRLSDHNARRRRVQPESSVRLLPTGFSSSALYDQRQQNLLLSGLPVPHPNSRWEDANTYMLRQGLIRPFELRMDLDKLCPIQSSNQRVLDQCLQIPTSTGSSNVVPDLINARSLLSSNPWSLNEGQSTSVCDGLGHGNYNRNSNNNNVLLMSKSSSEPQNMSAAAFQSHGIIYNPVEQSPAVTMVQSVNEGISHQQEYQLLKADAHDSTGFCSSRRVL